MKGIRIAVLGLALALTSTVAGAQGGGGGGGGRGAGRGNPAMMGIELTPEQQAKITEINTKYAADRPDRALMQSDRAAYMKKQAEYQAKTNPEIRAVLTADQQAVWDKNQAAMKARADSMAKAAPPAI